MKAVILAGGKGKRLRPYTYVFPKPLVPLDETPILEVVLRQLENCDFQEVILATGHQSNIIRSFCENGQSWDLDIRISKEEDSLGTMGPLNLIGGLNEPFLVMNGDLLTDFRYDRFLNNHREDDAVASVATYEREKEIDFGILETNGNHNVTAFREKPTYTFQVSMGIYAFDPAITEHIPDRTPFGFDDLMNSLLDDGEDIQTYPFDGHWMDIGREEDYREATDLFSDDPERFLSVGTNGGD